jgi:hypothetical protein
MVAKIGRHDLESDERLMQTRIIRVVFFFFGDKLSISYQASDNNRTLVGLQLLAVEEGNVAMMTE